MKQRRLIYAFLLAVIYITATSMSSLSIITCDHQHHHHHEHHEHKHNDGCCGGGCHCNNLTIGEDCCSHHHPILGDNHTDFIASSERNDSRASQLLTLILSPILISEEYVSESINSTTLRGPTQGDEATPLLAALLETGGLRAPPVMA